MQARVSGWVAEFSAPHEVLHAVRALRDEGYRDLEIHSPYELDGASEALGLERPRYVPRSVLLAGLCGAAGGYGIQWLTNAWLYPLAVGGRPPHSAPAFIPIAFESGILFAAIAAFVCVLAGGRLLRLWQPVFELEGFERATLDRYYVVVRASDPRFDPSATHARLEELDALRVQGLGPPHLGPLHDTDARP